MSQARCPHCGEIIEVELNVKYQAVDEPTFRPGDRVRMIKHPSISGKVVRMPDRINACDVQVQWDGMDDGDWTEYPSDELEKVDA